MLFDHRRDPGPVLLAVLRPWRQCGLITPLDIKSHAMSNRILSAAICLGLLTSPTAAIACDLDGLPGFHRFNPFAKLPGFGGLAPPSGPPQKQTQPEQPAPKAEAKGDEKSSEAKATKASTPLDTLEKEQDARTASNSSD